MAASTPHACKQRPAAAGPCRRRAQWAQAGRASMVALRWLRGWGCCDDAARRLRGCSGQMRSCREDSASPGMMTGRGTAMRGLVEGLAAARSGCPAVSGRVFERDNKGTAKRVKKMDELKLDCSNLLISSFFARSCTTETLLTPWHVYAVG